MDKIGNALERIADALERIATAIERGAAISGDSLSAAADLVKKSQELGEQIVQKPLQPEVISVVEQTDREEPAQETESGLIKHLGSDETEDTSLSTDEAEELIFELPSNHVKEDFAKRYPCLSEFLESRGITICDVFAPLVPKSLDDRLEEIALYMGNRYSDICPLLLAIKANLRTGFNFSLDFASCSASSAKVIDKLCRALYEIAFLDEYRYLGYPDFKVQARASTIGIAHNFFSGFWFERYVAQQTEAVIKSVRREFNLAENEFEIIRNAKLMCQGIPRERDILVSCANQYYWLECKSGDNYIDSIAAYDTFSAHFGFEQDNCFLVFLSNEAGYHRAAGSGMQICSSAEFSSRFADLLRHNLEKAGYVRVAQT